MSKETAGLSKPELTQKFVYSTTTVNTFKEQKGQLQDKLLPEVYVLEKGLFGFFLTREKLKFEVPTALYGSINKRSDKIIAAFERREVSTGALLTGAKGSGKSELMKVTANKMLAKGYPVLVINEPYSGQDFMDYIESLGEIVVMFDEFAKTYKKAASKDDMGDPQDGLLTLFDGMASSKRLMLVSENKKYEINEFMLERPGRMLYHFEYDKLEEAVIVEFCNANNIRQTFIDELVAARNITDVFSFDILKAIVAEHLAFPEDSLEEVVEDMNVNLAEPSYTFTSTKVGSPLITAGFLVEPQEIELLNFDRHEHYEDNSTRVDFQLTEEFLAKFSNSHSARGALESIMYASRKGQNKEMLEKAINDVKALPNVEKTEPDTMRQSLHSARDAVWTIYLCGSNLNAEMDGKLSYTDNLVSVEGKISVVKKSSWNQGYSNWF